MSAALEFSPSPADLKRAFGGFGGPPNIAAGASVVRDHTACCVSEALAADDEAEQRAKFSELIALFEKVKR